MITAPLLATLSGAAPTVDVSVSLSMLLGAGMLVGVGVTFGSGCTSGHGVCGNARFSGRSIVATVTFMVTVARFIQSIGPRSEATA